MKKTFLLTALFALLLLSSFLTFAPNSMVATVSADKMNVFYIGVDNPLSVSVSGVDPSLVSINVTGGTYKGGKGNYMISCTATGTVTVDVFAKTEKGNEKINSYSFRAKRIPDPAVTYGGMRNYGSIKKTEMGGLGTNITATIDGFDFNATVTINSFTLIVSDSNGGSRFFTGSGSSITNEMRTAMNNAPVGSYITIANVSAKLPDGATRTISGLTFMVRN